MRLQTSRAGKRWLPLVVLLLLSATGGCKQGAWTLWNAYAARFIDDQGRVFDPKAPERTTSEGEAYAMFFALADNDRAHFDSILNWTQENLARGDLGLNLPAWLWGKDKDGSWKALDANSASDADVWIAYSLLEAGRLWSAPAYTGMGNAMLNRIASTEVADLPGFGLMLLPGGQGFLHQATPSGQGDKPKPAGQSKDRKSANHANKAGKQRSHDLPPPPSQAPPAQTYLLNPSYVPEFLLERLGRLDPAGPWLKIAANIPRFLQQSSRHGFAMDWVDYVPGDGFSPVSEQMASGVAKDEAGGSYDAIRVYLWAGMIAPGGEVRNSLLNAIPGMGVYLADHGAPPEKVSDQGGPLAQDGPVGFSAAVLPYLRARAGSSRSYAQQLVRLSRMRDAATGLYGKDLTYYDQNLVLFATGFLEGRFQFGSGGELKVEWKRK
jgi:endoglucanase